MQQNNYIEAEDAYHRALAISPDNNKMCNLGIWLMKQGRISEAKENLGRVKPAVTDGPKGTDSHLKAYERAQQILKDLEYEMMSKGEIRSHIRRNLICHCEGLLMWISLCDFFFFLLERL